TGSGSSAVTVLGSSHELSRAVTNLVANAIRHTPAEGTVVVSVRATAAGAEVSVRDECGGIAEDELARVFDVGFRGEAARTPRPTEGTGAGLGLAIARGIVEAHDGTVDVHNVP